MNYRISSKAYLQRARQRLDEATLEALFYAGFELRCGIEARLQEYLEEQEHISKKKKKGWKIAELQRNLEEAFDTGDKVIAFIVYNLETRVMIHEFYYTPVNSKLRKMAEQLGNYMHSMKIYKSSSDIWWSEFRTSLESIYEELRKANIGTMLGIPLLDPETKQVHFTSEARNGETVQSVLDRFGGIGNTVGVWVRYLDDIPERLL